MDRIKTSISRFWQLIPKGDDSWITDCYRTPKLFVPLLFVVAFYAGNILVDSLASRVALWLHPELGADTPEFYAYLGTNPWEYMAVQLVWLAALCAAMAWAGIRFFGSWRGVAWRKIALWFAFGLALTLALQGLSVWLTSQHGVTANQMLLNQQLAGTSWPRKFVAFMLIPAFGEELIMRGVVQRYVFPKLPYIGIFASAFLFQNLHYTTRLSDALLYFASGLAYALVYHKTGRVEVTMAVHALNNLLALILLSQMVS